MSAIYGIPDNLLTFDTTAAMSAYNVATPVNGKVVGNGELVQVTPNGLFQYLKNGNFTVNGTTVFAATPTGIWVDYFTATGQTSVSINSSTNKIVEYPLIVATGTLNTAGGTASLTFTIPGMVDTDILSMWVISSTTAVTVQKVSHSGTTATVLNSAAPGTSVYGYTLLRPTA